MSEKFSMLWNFFGQENEISAVEIKGMIDGTYCEEFKGELVDKVGAGVKLLILNLHGTDYINSAGIGAIMAVLGKLKECQGRLVIVGASGKVKRTIEMVGVDNIVTMVETFEGAKSIIGEYIQAKG